MNGARVYQMREGHLVYPAQSLIIGVRNDVYNQRVIDGDKTMNGIVDYFSRRVIHPVAVLLNNRY
jgi:hypothetical protein